MKFLKIPKYLIVLVFLLSTVVAGVLVNTASAAPESGCTIQSLDACKTVTECEKNGGSWSKTDQLCGSFDSALSKEGNCKNINSCDLIKKYLNPFIALVGAGTGIAIVIAIVIGGIQYSSSAGDPQKASAAKTRIRNALIALFVFLFLYSLLNFLIPGGLFRGA